MSRHAPDLPDAGANQAILAAASETNGFRPRVSTGQEAFSLDFQASIQNMRNLVPQYRFMSIPAAR